MSVWHCPPGAGLITPVSFGRLLRTQPALTEQTVAAEPLEAVFDGAAGGSRSDARIGRIVVTEYPLRTTPLRRNRWRGTALMSRRQRVFSPQFALTPPCLTGSMSTNRPPNRCPVGRCCLGNRSVFLSGGNSQLATRYRSLCGGAIRSRLPRSLPAPAMSQTSAWTWVYLRIMARRLVPSMVLGKTPFGNDNLDYGSQAPLSHGVLSSRLANTHGATRLIAHLSAVADCPIR